MQKSILPITIVVFLLGVGWGGVGWDGGAFWFGNEYFPQYLMKLAYTGNDYLYLKHNWYF